jgi:hypothetical protein
MLSHANVMDIIKNDLERKILAAQRERVRMRSMDVLN